MIDISVVIVAFRSDDVLPGALDALPPGVEILVVEQCADGRSAEAAKAFEREKSIRVIHSGKNRGFGAGCNLGAANAHGDVLVFLNPDARIDESNLTRLAAAVVANNGTAVGPLILDSVGQLDTRVRRWVSAWEEAAYLVLPRQLFPQRRWKEVPSTDPVYLTGGEVAFVQGSCFGISRALFHELGGFDERFFLYGEEEWLALKLARKGLRERLLADVVATHEGATSTKKVGAFSTRQMYRSQALLYTAKAGRLRGAACTAILGASVLALLITTPIRRAVRFRPNEDAAWCRAVIGGLVDGLLERPVTPPNR